MIFTFMFSTIQVVHHEFHTVLVAALLLGVASVLTLDEPIVGGINFEGPLGSLSFREGSNAFVALLSAKFS